MRHKYQSMQEELEARKAAGEFTAAAEQDRRFRREGPTWYQAEETNRREQTSGRKKALTFGKTSGKTSGRTAKQALTDGRTAGKTAGRTAKEGVRVRKRLHAEEMEVQDGKKQSSMIFLIPVALFVFSLLISFSAFFSGEEEEHFNPVSISEYSSEEEVMEYVQSLYYADADGSVLEWVSEEADPELSEILDDAGSTYFWTFREGNLYLTINCESSADPEEEAEKVREINSLVLDRLDEGEYETNFVTMLRDEDSEELYAVLVNGGLEFESGVYSEEDLF